VDQTKVWFKAMKGQIADPETEKLDRNMKVFLIPYRNCPSSKTKEMHSWVHLTRLLLTPTICTFVLILQEWNDDLALRRYIDAEVFKSMFGIPLLLLKSKEGNEL
jgi:hypothetical protein